MFRGMMLTTVATVMMASTVFAAPERAKTDREESKDKTEKVETVGKAIESGKATANQERIYSLASKLVDSASKDSKCTVKCQNTLQALEVVVRGKDGLGLAGNLKPETAVIRISKLAKTMSVSDALDQVMKDQNIKQDSLLKCAGKPI